VKVDIVHMQAANEDHRLACKCVANLHAGCNIKLNLLMTHCSVFWETKTPVIINF